nr:MAG TPA: hypothetical protein [Caudoviricetes sp.]
MIYQILYSIEKSYQKNKHHQSYLKYLNIMFLYNWLRSRWS